MDGARLALSDIGSCRDTSEMGARGLFAFLDPLFHFIQIPHDAARRQVEAARELAAALHFVDRRFGQGDHLPQLVAADGASKRKGAALRELRQCLVGCRPWQGKGLAGIDAGRVGCL